MYGQIILQRAEQNDLLLKPQKEIDNLIFEIQEYFNSSQSFLEEKGKKILNDNQDLKESLRIDENELLKELNVDGKEINSQKLQKLVLNSLQKLTIDHNCCKNEDFEEYLYTCQEMKQKFRNFGDKMEEQFQNISTYIAKLQGQMSKEMEQLVKLTSENNDILKKNEVMQKEMQKLRQRMQEKQSKINDKEIQIEISNKAQSDCQRDCDKITQCIKNLEKIQLRIQQQESKLSDKIYSLGRKINDIIEEKDQLIQEQEEVESQIEEYQRQINEKQNKINEINEEREKKRESGLQKSFIGLAGGLMGTLMTGGLGLIVMGAGLATQLSSISDLQDFKSLQNEKNYLIEERDHITNKKYKCQQTIDNLKEQINDNNNKLYRKKEKLTNLRYTKQQNQNELSSNLAKKSQCQQQKIEITQQIEIYQYDIDSWRQDIIQLTRQCLSYQENLQKQNLELLANEQKEVKLKDEIKKKNEAIQYLEKLELPEEKLKYFSQIQLGMNHTSQAINKFQNQFNEVNTELSVIGQRAKSILRQIEVEDDLQGIEAQTIQRVSKILQDSQKMLVSAEKQLQCGFKSVSQLTLQNGSS